MISLRAFNVAASSRILPSRRNFVPRRTTSTMAAKKDGVSLDKNTPDGVWKEILSAEEVRFWGLQSCGGRHRTEQTQVEVEMVPETHL